MGDSEEPTSDLVEALRSPAAYPWRPSTVEPVATHMSWVFIAGDRVVKVRRPVRYSFVDHTDPAARRHACDEEVRLNRRLSDGVYLGVVPITADRGGLRIDGAGPVVEWATLMRRLPADRMLDHLIQTDSVPPDAGDRLAQRLIPFHRRTAARCDDRPWGTTDSTAQVLLDNLTDLEPFAGDLLGPRQLDLVGRAVRAAIAADWSLLNARGAAGWVRDGHGDLRAEHVCLEPDGAVQIYDAVEFSPALRCADVASDLGYLLVDLQRLGASRLAAGILAAYLAAGVDLPPRLLRLYLAHRSLVRAKITCLSIASGALAPERGGETAVHALDLASTAALAVRPALLVMTGLSGTGKSTVAGRLARALGVPLVASDVVRKRLAGVEGAAPAELDEGIYAAAWTERAYGELLRLARESLVAGSAVVLDATFLEARWRTAAADLARSLRLPFLLIETTCDEAVVLDRLRRRAERGGAVSDATIEVFRAQLRRAAAGPAPIPEGALHVRVDTAAPPARLVEPVVDRLAALGLVVPDIPSALPPDLAAPR